MKISILFFMLIVVVPFTMKAQQIDDNTLAINNYFQSVYKNPVKKDATPHNSELQPYLNLVQTGNENTIYIKSLQTDDNQTINQNGSQNNYEYYNFYNKENSNLNINQEGTLNSLQVFGENSLMKNAIINQKSNFKSVVIKNYTQ